MGAMKRLFIELTEEIHEDCKKNRWKDTRRDKSYTWEEAQQQVYKIANKYGTEEIIAKVFHPSNLKKYPTILKWDKIWEEKWKEALERTKKNRKARAKVVKDYIAKRWPNGVPKPEPLPPWLTQTHDPPDHIIRRYRRQKPFLPLERPLSSYKMTNWDKLLQDPVEAEKLAEEGRKYFNKIMNRN